MAGRGDLGFISLTGKVVKPMNMCWRPVIRAGLRSGAIRLDCGMPYANPVRARRRIARKPAPRPRPRAAYSGSATCRQARANFAVSGRRIRATSPQMWREYHHVLLSRFSGMQMNNSHGEGNEGLEWAWATLFGCCRRPTSIDGRRRWWEEPLNKRMKIATGHGFVGPGSFECYD